MNRRAALRAIVALPFSTARGTRAVRSQDGGWLPLLDGRDLADWDTWLGKPYGLNSDSKGVFSVVPVDGAPAIRISGEIYGALDDARGIRELPFALRVQVGRAAMAAA